ncbi:MAG: redoxin family protein [Bacteroidetes bacterium]|nr:redoxin family protein [Bacteroidota bacterium]
MKNIIPILALFFVFGFYPSTSSGQNIKQPIRGQIVLIFKNAPDNSYFIGKIGIKEKKSDYQISYIDDHLIHRGFNFKNVTMYDTLVIKTHRNFIELIHSYKGLSSMGYLIKNGDTVLFTYQGNKPWAQVLNRKVLSSEINYDYLVNERIRHDDYSAMTKYSHLSEFTKNPPPSFKEQFAMEKVQFEKESKVELAKTNYFLDSMRKANAISETYYNYQKINFIYSLHSLAFYYKWKFSDSLLKNNKFQDILFPTLTRENDTLLFYNYYREYISKKYNTLQLKVKKIKKIVTPNSFSTDYREVFDSICNWNNLYVKVKNYFLLQTMEYISQEYSESDFEKYTKKFRKEVKDTALLSYFEQKYRIDPPTSNELELQDIRGNNKTFKEILNSHKGKVVYVDFWASWCGACRANMPDSKKLDTAFGPKGVVFIYISMDVKLADWKECIQKIGLNENNYVIRNPKSSKMLEELEIYPIPRYLLYNKQGKLVHKNAPRPVATVEIRKLFDQYLLE